MTPQEFYQQVPSNLAECLDYLVKNANELKVCTKLKIDRDLDFAECLAYSVAMHQEILAETESV